MEFPKKSNQNQPEVTKEQIDNNESLSENRSETQAVDLVDYQRVLRILKEDSSISLPEKIKLFENATRLCTECIRKLNELSFARRKDWQAMSQRLGITLEPNEDFNSLNKRIGAYNDLLDDFFKLGLHKIKKAESKEIPKRNDSEGDSARDGSHEKNKVTQENLEAVEFSLKNIQAIYVELSRKLSKNKFLKIKLELDPLKGLEVDENGRINGLNEFLQEINSQISKIGLPPGLSERLSIEVHGVRTVIEEIENLRSELIKLKNRLLDIDYPIEDLQKIVVTIDRKRDYLLRVIPLIQR